MYTADYGKHHIGGFTSILWLQFYNSLIVSVTVLDKILFIGFTTDVAEANATTNKMMSNSLTGTVHGTPKYAEMINRKNFLCKSKPRLPPVNIPETA